MSNRDDDDDSDDDEDYSNIYDIDKGSEPVDPKKM